MLHLFSVVPRGLIHTHICPCGKGEPLAEAILDKISEALFTVEEAINWAKSERKVVIGLEEAY